MRAYVPVRLCDVHPPSVLTLPLCVSLFHLFPFPPRLPLLTFPGTSSDLWAEHPVAILVIRRPM